MNTPVTYDICNNDSLRAFRSGKKARCHLKINFRVGNREIAQAAIVHLVKTHKQVQENLGQNKSENLLVHRITLECYVGDGEVECDPLDYAETCRELFKSMIIHKIVFSRVPAMFKVVYHGLHGKHKIGALEVHHVDLCTPQQRSLLEKPVIRSFPSLTFRHCKLTNRDVEALLERAVVTHVRESEFFEVNTICKTAIEMLNVEHNCLTKEVLPSIAKYALTRLSANSTILFSAYLGANKFKESDLDDETLGDMQTIYTRFPDRFVIQLRRRHTLFDQDIGIRETFNNFADVIRDVEMEMIEQKEIEDVAEAEEEDVNETEEKEEKVQEDYSSEKENSDSEEERGEKIDTVMKVDKDEPLLRSESYNRNFQREWEREFPAAPLHTSTGSPNPFMRSMLSIRKKLHSKPCPKCKKMIIAPEMTEHMEYHRTHTLCIECQIMVPNEELVKHVEHETCTQCTMVIAKPEMITHMKRKHKF